MQCCRIISLDNNNSVKFTSSRGDNSTTNNSMVMKIAHAQLHMYTNIMSKFQSSTCKTVGEKLRTKLYSPTDGHENCICATSFMCKFQRSTCKKCRSNARLEGNGLEVFTLFCSNLLKAFKIQNNLTIRQYYMQAYF